MGKVVIAKNLDQMEADAASTKLDTTTIKVETDKIDNVAADGLLGLRNSLAHKVDEIGRHLHSGTRWFETAATPSGETHVADRSAMGLGPSRSTQETVLGLHGSRHLVSVAGP